MSGQQDDSGSQDPQQFLEQLRDSGFFDQIAALDGNIHKIANGLQELGHLATQRVEETENLAAHVLAIEAILAVILKSHPVEPDAVKDAIKEMTANIAGEAEGSTAVHSVVDSLLPTKDG